MLSKIFSLVAVVVLVAGAILLWPLRGFAPAVQPDMSLFVPVAAPQLTPTMNITAIQLAPAVVKGVKELGTLETYSMDINQPVRLTRSDALVLGLKDAEQIELLVGASVIAGVDLDSITADDIQASADGLSIVIPSAHILNVVPDESTLLPVSHTVSLFGKQRDSFVQLARTTALDAIRKTAIEHAICKTASEKAEKKIRIFIERLGVNVLSVSSKDGSCS